MRECGTTIAFELPKREGMNVRVFRDGTLEHRSLLLFTEYLVTDRLYAWAKGIQRSART